MVKRKHDFWWIAGSEGMRSGWVSGGGVVSSISSTGGGRGRRTREIGSRGMLEWE